MPDFYVQSGFDDNEIDVRAFILDYYFDHTLQGFWIGAGLENWQGTVAESSSNTEKEYDSNLFTIGGGYTYYLNQYFYINPWIGIHVPVSGDDNVTFTDSSFDIKTTTEASIKFGYKF